MAGNNHSNKPFFVSLLACVVGFFRRLAFRVQSWWFRSSGPIITFDTGRRVRLGRQIAQGGFSIVFEATDASTNNNNSTEQKYALKRISCPDPEILRACRNEAGIHRSVKHPNLMPLLGMSVDTSTATPSHHHLCYMLFPYMPHSLRHEVNRRTFERNINDEPPWPSELVVLQIFYAVLQGVSAFHEQSKHAHCDIKLENILLLSNINMKKMNPVLMDFGSARPLMQTINNRRDVIMVAEQAAMHTTISYRPPELFEGEVQRGDAPIDYTKVDVWSLGCTLFAMLYGASPFESEFYNTNKSNSNNNYCLRVTECTQLSVLKPVPRPPAHLPAANWYSDEMHRLIEYMLQQDRHKRPTLAPVMQQVEKVIIAKGGHIEQQQKQHDVFDDVDIMEGDGIALITNDRMMGV